MRPLAKTTRNEADTRGVDQDPELRAAFERLRSGGAFHPRVVSAVSVGGPAHPRAVSAVPAGGPSHPLAVTVPPQRAIQQLRELHERHRREDADIRAVLRAWRPPVTHDRPSSTHRPRERGARMVAVGGRNGDGARDDGGGSGSDDGGGGGSDPPPPSRSGMLFAGRRPW